MLKKPMTTEVFFDKMCDILKEKGMMPDILDYALATSEPVPMQTYEYSIRNNLDYGGSEGIYLDLWIEYYDEDRDRQRRSLGTIKTLREDDEAMHIMANLLADFVTQQRRFVNANLDDFTWRGADVYPMDKDGNRASHGWSCGSMDSALKKKGGFQTEKEAEASCRAYEEEYKKAYRAYHAARFTDMKLNDFRKEKLGDGYIDGDYISCRENGLPRAISSFNTALTKLCGRNGLPHLTVHTTFEYYCEVMDEQERIISFMNDSFVPGTGGKE